MLPCLSIIFTSADDKEDESYLVIAPCGWQCCTLLRSLRDLGTHHCVIQYYVNLLRISVHEFLNLLLIFIQKSKANVLNIQKLSHKHNSVYCYGTLRPMH